MENWFAFGPCRSKFASLFPWPWKPTADGNSGTLATTTYQRTGSCDGTVDAWKFHPPRCALPHHCLQVARQFPVEAAGLLGKCHTQTLSAQKNLPRGASETSVLTDTGWTNGGSHPSVSEKSWSTWLVSWNKINYLPISGPSCSLHAHKRCAVCCPVLCGSFCFRKDFWTAVGRFLLLLGCYRLFGKDGEGLDLHIWTLVQGTREWADLFTAWSSTCGQFNFIVTKFLMIN